MPVLERERISLMQIPETGFSFARPGLAKLERAIAYEPGFDQRTGLKPSYLSKQIDTFLGERLNVLLSKNKYEIKNNLMWGEDIDEPFEDVIKRGIDYRQKIGGIERIDKRREEAELEGFLRIQEILCNPNTPVGTMMLSISPKGEKDSLYQHNFYDIFTLREAYGKRFVEARRYSSALSQDEYKEKLNLFYPKLYGKDVKIDDAYFLSHPVNIKKNSLFENADQLHSYLHKDHDAMDSSEFQRVIKKCEGLKQIYIQTRNPKVLDAIMNKADEAAGFVSFKYDKFYPFMGPSIELNKNWEVNFYGGQKVRPVAAGCGSSSSASENSKSSPFSVSDFGEVSEDKYGDREFDCPVCGKTNIRLKDTLISKCQHCGSSKVAC